MSNAELTLLACAVWFVGIFVSAYLIGRFDTVDQDDNFTLAFAAFCWPVVLSLFVFWCVLRANVLCFIFLINAPFKAGLRHRQRNRVDFEPHSRNGRQ